MKNIWFTLVKVLSRPR